MMQTNQQTTFKSNPALDQLSVFIGEWNSEIPDSDFPTSTSVMGPDDAAGTYCMLYYDSRAVSRIYRMTFSGGIWTLWREFPGFS
jgi:hypothetical protein